MSGHRPGTVDDADDRRSRPGRGRRPRRHDEDHDAFEIRRGGFSPVTTSEYVAEALSRTRAIAGGQQLQSIGVTWSDDAAIEASLLLDSLADYGFRNVVPIRLPEATGGVRPRHR